jgi:hypothetical protein
VAATCTDNIGVAGVQFKLNGANLLDDTVFPYAITWDSSSSGNGTYTLSADCRDAAGNHNVASESVTVTSGQGGGPPVGNIFVDSNGGTCTRSATPVAYVDAAACSDLNAAYVAASGGDLVLVESGTYGVQTIPYVNKGTSVVSFKPDGGASLTVAGLTVNTSYVTFDGINFPASSANANDGGGADLETPSINAPWITNVTLKNSTGLEKLDIKGDNILIQNVTVSGLHACLAVGGFPPGTWEDGVQVNRLDLGNGTSRAADHVTFDNLTVHDVDRWRDPSVGAASGTTCTNGAVPHTDGMQLAGGTNIVIKNSHFYRNATSNILASNVGGAPLDHIQIENTMTGLNLEAGGNDITIFPVGTAGASCGSTNDFVFDYDTVSAINVSCGGTPGISRGVIYRAGSYTCGNVNRNLTYTYNSFGSTSDTGCSGSTGAQVCNPTFTDASRDTTGNYDLSASDTCAKAHGDPVTFPATDIHGVTRTSVPDIGADKAG